VQKTCVHLLVLLPLGVLLLAGSPASAQEPDRAAEFYDLINQSRLGEGLTPYGWAPELTASAQRHADDLAAHQLASHTGSDESTAAQRIAEANYGAWEDGSVTGENFWVGFGSVQEALDWFMDDPTHRDNILNSRYREVGIGVASDSEGRLYYVLDFGARPNVLPIFIDDGREATESTQVAIRLNNEEARPQGQGTLYVGRAIEVRVSNGPDLEDLPWQPWEPLIAWTLPVEPGEHTVYVQFRDGAGRTTTSVDAITLLAGEGTATPEPPTAAPTPSPPATETAPPEATLAPSETPAAAPSPSAVPPLTAVPTPVAEATAGVFATWTPLPPPAPVSTTNGSGRLVGLVCMLQVAAVLLGIYLGLRRRPS
jgi:uncharacterized protein YkwD